MEQEYHRVLPVFDPLDAFDVLDGDASALKISDGSPLFFFLESRNGSA
jgi:hypothetical protein